MSPLQGVRLRRLVRAAGGMGALEILDVIEAAVVAGDGDALRSVLLFPGAPAHPEFDGWVDAELLLECLRRGFDSGDAEFDVDGLKPETRMSAWARADRSVRKSWSFVDLCHVHGRPELLAVALSAQHLAEVALREATAAAESAANALPLYPRLDALAAELLTAELLGDFKFPEEPESPALTAEGAWFACLTSCKAGFDGWARPQINALGQRAWEGRDPLAQVAANFSPASAPIIEVLLRHYPQAWSVGDHKLWPEQTALLAELRMRQHFDRQVGQNQAEPEAAEAPRAEPTPEQRRRARAL